MHKRKMKTLKITHFFDVIKKEVSEFKPISPTKNNGPDLKFNVKREYIKEEVDIPWDETSFLVEKDQDDVFSGKSINMFSARVVIDKLPESTVQKYSKSEMKTIENYENNTEECVSSILPTNFITNSSNSSRHEVLDEDTKTKANPKEKIRDGLDHDDVFSAKSINIFSARVVIDKLPESTAQKYSKSRMKTIDSNHESSPEECISSILPTNFTAKSPTSSRHNVSKTEANPKKKIKKGLGFGFYWKICQKCNTKKRQSIRCIGVKSECHRCKTRLIFECEKCHKQLGTIKCMKSHVRSECGKKGHYYKCFECNFKASYIAAVQRHVKKMHPTMTSKMHCIEKIESDNMQNDLSDVRCKKFNCSKCEKKFEYLPILMRHVQNCTGKKGATNKDTQSTDKELRINIRNRIMFYCQKCDKDVMYRRQLRETKTRKIECPDCKTFMAFKCLECKKQYNSRDGVTIHIKSTHMDKQEYKCSECIYKTSNFKHLCNHYRYMHMPAIHECSRCGKIFDKHYFLYIHLQQCGLEPQYHCDHCSFKSHYRKYFIAHMLRHTPGNEIDCPTCKLTFKNKICLSGHQKRCGKLPYMKCDHCPYKTNDRSALIKHISRIHSIEKEIECPICKKMQRNKQRLKDHLKTCKLDYSQCKFCSFKTKFVGVLREHTLRQHSKNKSISSIIEETGLYKNVTLKEYRCDHCSFKTHIKSDIYLHIVKKHLKERNLKCSRCAAKFQNNVYLRMHLKYCGLTPYLHCEHCTFKTYLKGSLAAHMIKSHIAVECSKCKRSYHSKSSFLRCHGHWKRSENQCK